MLVDYINQLKTLSILKGNESKNKILFWKINRVLEYKMSNSG